MSNQQNTADRLAEIEQRVQAATPGPWQLDGPFWWRGGDTDPDCAVMITAAADREAVCVMPERDRQRGYSDADAELIAHAPSDLAWAAQRIRELEARQDRVRALHQSFVDTGSPVCGSCFYAWPCDTARALDGES